MTEAHVSDEEEEVIAKQPKPKQHDAGASDLEGIRDFRDEEVDIGTVDTSSLLNANSIKKDTVKIKVNKEDIEVITSEMMVSNAVAERCLRDHKGDVRSALLSLINC